MIGAHIQDGDLAIISPQPDVENGRIVAVIVEGILPEATLKIVRKKRYIRNFIQRIRLILSCGFRKSKKGTDSRKTGLADKKLDSPINDCFSCHLASGDSSVSSTVFVFLCCSFVPLGKGGS
jgi:hypothetical protein